jgi:hypothetical protein
VHLFHARVTLPFVALAEAKTGSGMIANKTAKGMEPNTARLDRTNTSTGYSTVVVDA